jgi:hypothetical protein
MVKKISPAQMKTLQAISKLLDKIPGKINVHRSQLPGVRVDVLDRMAREGLIDSAQPFAFAYHKISLTDKGRKALGNGG